MHHQSANVINIRISFNTIYNTANIDYAKSIIREQNTFIAGSILSCSFLGTAAKESHLRDTLFKLIDDS